MSSLVITPNMYEYTDASGNTQTIQLGNLYSIEGVSGVNGSGQISIGQAVMAICLTRATELEEELIDLMEELEVNTAKLDALSAIEEALVEWQESASSSENYTFSEDDTVTIDGTQYTWSDFLASSDLDIGLISSGTTSLSYDSVETLITDLESKMDELNSFSQDTMIDIQSVTSKRDQSYDMISNILKSLNTTMTGNANNI